MALSKILTASIASGVLGGDNPSYSSISPSVATNDATNITISGGNFVSIPRVDAVSSTGVITPANSVSFTNITTIVANFTLATDGTYYIRIENNDGGAVRSINADLTISDAPTWTTSSGTLGTIAGDFSGTIATVAASGDTVTFTETTNVLTNSALANCSLSTAGVITTSDFAGSNTTAATYTFTIRATDAQNQTADREFTLTSSFYTGSTGGGQFN